MNKITSTGVNWFTRTSIFERILVASFLISIFPLLINIAVYFSSTERLLFKETQQKLERLIEVKNSRISDITQRQINQVQSYATAPSVSEGFSAFKAAFELAGNKGVEYQSAFGKYAPIFRRDQQLGLYQDLMFLSLGGDVLFRLNSDHALSKPVTDSVSSLGDRFQAQYLEVIRTGKSSLGGVVWHASGAQVSSLAMTPLSQGADLLGVVVVVLEQQDLLSLFSDYTSLGKSGEFLVLGKVDKQVVNYSPRRFDAQEQSNSEGELHESELNTFYEKALDASVDTPYIELFFDDYRGQQVFSMWRELDAIEGVLVVKMDKSELFSGINDIQTYSMWVALVSIIFVIPASFFLARAISVPIQKLEQATVHIAAGNKGLTLEHAGGAEISALAVSFQLMALRVESFKGRLTKQLKEQQELASKFEKACDQAEKNEAIISNILDLAAESMVTLDANGEVQSFNAAAELMFLWDKEEAMGQPFLKFLDLSDIKYEGNGEGHSSLFDRLTLGSQELTGVKYNNLCFPVELSLAKVKIEKEVLYTAIIRDITERKKTEYYLQQAKHAAEEASHTKTLFLANVSHELKTPMNSILGFTRRLKLRLKGVIGEQDLDCLETVHNNAENLLALITDLLDLSTLDAGEMRLNVERVDIVSLLTKVGKQLGPLAEEKNLRLILEFPDRPEEIVLDPRKVSQIAVNLLYNSIKYTDQGEVCIGMDAVNDADYDGAIRFYVRDTGIGIDEDQQQHLFKNFVQLDAGSSRERDGAGLGLAITAELVSLHGGSIAVESTLGQGSVFSVTLPRAS